jgi:hypothetical protein
MPHSGEPSPNASQVGIHPSSSLPRKAVSQGVHIRTLYGHRSTQRWYLQSDSSSFEGVKPSSSVNRTGEVKGRQAMSWFVVARS